MRALPVLVLLVLLVAALLTMQWLGSGGEAAPEPASGALATESPAAPAAVGTAAAPPTPGTAPAQAPTVVATRLQVPTPEPAALADQPTAWLQVTDHAQGTPIAGAAVRSVQRGGDLAFTDERGLAALPLRDREQLAIVLDGYLLRLVPTRLGSTETEPQAVTLVADHWSPRRVLELPRHPGAEVLLWIRPLDAGRETRAPVPATDAVLTRAWTEHVMLAGRPSCADVPVQQGAATSERVHRLRSGATLRFCAPGRYAVDAATATGLVARSELRIAFGEQAPQPLRLELVPGVRARGVVVDRDLGTPLAGATLAVSGGDPLGLLATTGSDGTFDLGPLLPGAVSLDVRHGEHEPLAFGPLQVPATGQRIALVPLPGTTLRGRVRVRPGLQPLAGATVQWRPNGGSVVTTISAADGTFTLRATGSLAARLQVQAAGHVPYAELVEPSAPFADYDVWPAERAVRVELGLSAALAGSVVDAEGRPVPGVAVRWQPARQVPTAVDVGSAALRRVLEGAVLDLPGVATTVDDGTFVLETNRFGAGQVVVVDGEPTGVAAEAIAGQTRDGLRLRR